MKGLFDMSEKLLVLVGSPRRNGNTATLAEAVRRGAEKAGIHVGLRFLDDHMTSFLRDCRTCRQANGECAIADGYRTLFFEDFLPARAVIFCSPIYWYGMSAQMKAFLDRSFCHYAASAPDSHSVLQAMRGKRLGLVLASEETYPGAALGIVHQMQEFSRYTQSDFVGVVRGIGNSRGDVCRDPANPVQQAEHIGSEILTRPYSDYRLDTERAPVVWKETGHTK
jgi:multimeric flavodoxin WrbA